jgi:hypothetical protein
MKALKFPVHGRSFYSELRVGLRWLAAAMIAIFLNHPPLNLRQVVFPEVQFQVFDERAMVSLAAGGKSW